jgi:5-carboxymethyl-2-hydroxymuconate isomerase
MPLTRISLLKGKSPAYLRAVGDSLHAALVEAFNVPDTDRFQLFHQHEPHEMSFDRRYEVAGDGQRSDDWLVFAITIGKPRTTAVKQAFYRRLVERLAQSPGVRPQDVMVTILPAREDDWSFADGAPATSLGAITA